MSETISNETFKQKYLKYKSKYINLKNELKGGLPEKRFNELADLHLYFNELFEEKLNTFQINKPKSIYLSFKSKQVTFEFDDPTVRIFEYASGEEERMFYTRSSGEDKIWNIFTTFVLELSDMNKVCDFIQEFSY